MRGFRSEDWFGKEQPMCALCEYGRWNASHTAILCPTRGVLEPDASCRRFRYDPLMREPSEKPVLPEYDPEDFML